MGAYGIRSRAATLEWNENGDEILVSIWSGDSRSTEWYVINTDTSVRIPLLSGAWNPANITGATWSRASQGVLLSYSEPQERGRDKSSILEVSRKASTITRLTAEQWPSINPWAPELWGPNGDELVVQTISGSGGWGIFNANSHEVVEFNLGDDQVFPLALAWNPIEPKLAVFLSGGRNQVSDELGILDFTTGKIHQITNTAACEGNTVKWSPDGQKLAFISWDKNSEVFVANADGSSMFNLTSSPFAHEFDVDWSSTDSRLAFVRFEASDGGTYSQDIYIQNANGTAARLLIDTPDADEFLPVWSPDGSMIAYWSMVADSSKGSGYARLNIVNSDGTGHKSIAEFP